MSARRSLIIGGAAAAVAGGAVLARGIARRRPPMRDRARGRWQTVTVMAPAETVMAGGLAPEPLAELDWVEVRVAPAAGGRGSELGARPRPGPAPAEREPERAIRSALRRSKQLIEVGEVLVLEPQPHGRRRATPFGAIVDKASARSGGEGVL